MKGLLSIIHDCKLTSKTAGWYCIVVFSAQRNTEYIMYILHTHVVYFVVPIHSSKILNY